MIEKTTKLQTQSKLEGLEKHAIPAFFALSFAIAWAIWIPTAVLAPQRLAVAVLPGAWAPSLSAVILTAATSGWSGVKGLLGRFLRWRANILWYLAALLGIGALVYLAIGLHVLLGGSAPEPALPEGLPDIPLLVYIPIAFSVNIIAGGPLAEEFGWRGFALPRLQSRIGALAASLVIGVLWGLWHLPFFVFAGGGQVVGHIPFHWFILLTTAWSVLFAWVYNNSGGSVLMAVLFHSAVNTWMGAAGYLQTGGGEMRPLVLNVVLTWLAVLVVVVVCGPERLSRGRE